jgi:hypothetical protein
LLLLLTGCVSGETPFLKAPELENPPEKILPLRFFIPSTLTPVTYAYTEEEESQINRLDLLFFRRDSLGREYYYRHLPLTSLVAESYNSFMANVNMESIGQRLVVVANMGGFFTAAEEEELRQDSIEGDLDKAALLNRIRYAFSGSWPAEGFPMYGESGWIDAKEQSLQEIKMTRAVCRIDLTEDFHAADRHIDSVYVFYACDRGYVAPAFDADGNALSTPHVPADAKPLGKPLAYPFIDNAGESLASMEREIYLPETDRQGALPMTVVLRIGDKGGRGHYYHLDLKKEDGTELPLLRNYRYRIHVTGFSGEGYASAQEAAEVSEQAKAETEVDAKELGIDYWVFNNDYRLGYSAEDITFNADGSWPDKLPADSYYRLQVYAEYPEWTVSWTKELAAWAQVGTSTAPGTFSLRFPNTQYDLPIRVDANPSSAARNCILHVSSGSLAFDFVISQKGMKN